MKIAVASSSLRLFYTENRQLLYINVRDLKTYWDGIYGDCVRSTIS